MLLARTATATGRELLQQKGRPMSLTTLAPVRAAQRQDAHAAPDCAECDQTMQPIGGPMHPYWTCRSCGDTVARQPRP